jgi:hypothetical protein
LQSGEFVAEAERLITWASEETSIAPLVRQERRRIEAGLNVFAARRLIDAGRHSEALGRLYRAVGQHPTTVVRYWYKVVQAGLSALGLAGLFESYRRIRRRLTYGRARVLPP